MSSSGASRQSIGDGLGLEELAAKICPSVARGRSLIRWVEGAFADLFIRIFGPASAVASQVEFEQAPRLEWAIAIQGHSRPNLARPWQSTLLPEQRQAALGVVNSASSRVEDYSRYSKMNVADVNAEPHCHMSEAVALDCIN